MIVSPSGYHSDALGLEFVRHCPRIVNNLSSICRKFRSEGFSKCYCLSKRYMIMWSSLDTWKYGSCNGWSIFLLRHNHCSSRSAKCFMCGCGNNITVWYRVFEDSSCNESCNMCNISHEDCSCSIRYLSKSLPIERTRVGRESCDDELWFMFLRQLLDNIHVDHFCRSINTIRDNSKHLSRVVQWMTV